MTNSLSAQHCAPCEGGIAPLTRTQTEELIASVPNWTLSADATSLSRTFSFKNFTQALVFVNQVGDLAEHEGHHPDIHWKWNTVQLVLSTHAIKGLSQNDFILAAKINELK